jgi:pSer/pThr/pTyr-binding forkhead associated (FHA) protein
MIPSDQSRAIPLVGPRAYKIGEKLFGRDRERLELLDLLIAERIVLLYSPSGAGKTSLVQAALVPALRTEAFTVPAVARVAFERAEGITDPAANRYVFAVLLSLEEARSKERQLPLAELARMTLPDYLEQHWATASETGGLVLILDQFEEVLTIDSTDTEAKKELFAQLGVSLRNPHRWALFAMREEHVAGLDPYRSLIPTRLNATFRLELLKEQQARQIMQEAFAEAGKVFTNGAARQLTDDLRRVRVQRPGGLLEEQFGLTVEPTQLQVVCLRLWNSLPTDKASIEESDVEAFGNADTALADYYAEAVAGLGSRERLVRDWIEYELISQRGLRNQILKDDALQSRRVDAQAIAALDESHLIREEQRRGISWLELAHDRLIEPIRRNNTAWREAHLKSFQRQAALWDREGRPNRLELSGAALSEAERWAAVNEITPVEQNYLRTCIDSRERESQRKRTTRIIRLFAALAFLLVMPYAAEWYWNWLRDQPWSYMTDIRNGELLEIRGDAVSIGRTAGPIKNKINVPYDNVSRLQLFVSRDRLAQDARSLNGTTINARFLRYGTERELRDGDLIALAGVALFRFSVAQRSLIPFLKPSVPNPTPRPEAAWAILIDGASRSTVPLTDSNYFLARNEQGDISLSKSATGGSLLKITGDHDELDLETLKTSDEYHLFAMLKYEDRTYFAIEVPFGQHLREFLKDDSGNAISGTEFFSKMSFCFGQPPSRGESVKIHGVETKVVPIETDEEPSCILGPFQIVLF